MELNDIDNYDPIPFDKSAIGNTNSHASVPVADLFDTDQYIEPSPDPLKTFALY